MRTYIVEFSLGEIVRHKDSTHAMGKIIGIVIEHYEDSNISIRYRVEKIIDNNKEWIFVHENLLERF